MVLDIGGIPNLLFGPQTNEGETGLSAGSSVNVTKVSARLDFTHTVADWQDITNSSVSVKVLEGQKVFILVGGMWEQLGLTHGIRNAQIYRDTTNIAEAGDWGAGDSVEFFSLNTIDVPGEGTFTYKLRSYTDEGSPYDNTIITSYTIAVIN